MDTNDWYYLQYNANEYGAEIEVASDGTVYVMTVRPHRSNWFVTLPQFFSTEMLLARRTQWRCTPTRKVPARSRRTRACCAAKRAALPRPKRSAAPPQ